MSNDTMTNEQEQALAGLDKALREAAVTIPEIIRPARLYLATPYTHRNPAVMEARFADAVAVTAWTLGRNIGVPFSPVAHWHLVAKVLPREYPHEFWMQLCKTQLMYSDELVIVPMEGWLESNGIAQEIEFAEALGIPVSIVQATIPHMQSGMQVISGPELERLSWRVFK